MKRCPECRKDYLDDSLMYCLDDGVALIQGTVAEEPATAVYPAAPVADEGVTRSLGDIAKDRSRTVSVARSRFLFKNTIAWVAPLALGLLLGVLGYGYLKGSSASRTAAIKMAFEPPPELAFNDTQPDLAVISPDGQKVVFTATSPEGKSMLYVRSLDSSEFKVLPGSDNALEPFWSPDSRSVAFGSNGKLKRSDLTGASAKVLCDAPRLTGGTWSKDGVIVFGPGYRMTVMQVSAQGGEAKKVDLEIEGDIEHRNPQFLPDGRHFLLPRREGLFAASIDSPQLKLVSQNRGPAIYAQPGWLIFLQNDVVMAQAFNADKLEVSGEPIPINPGMKNPGNNRRFSVSDNGILVWQDRWQREYQLVWYDRSGHQIGTVEAPMKVSVGESPIISPDGKRLAIRKEVTSSATDRSPGEGSNLWVVDLEKGTELRITSSFSQFPVWSPDGTRILHNNGNNIAVKPANGSGEAEILLPRTAFPMSWSADGRFIIFMERGPTTRMDLWALPMFGDRKEYQLLNSPFDEQNPQLSPDGRWLAYVSDETGNPEVYVQSFSADGKLGADKKIVSTGGGALSVWRRDGSELFFIASDGQMMVSAVKTGGASFEFAPAKPLFKTRTLTLERGTYHEYDVSPDGQRFLIGTPIGDPKSPLPTIVVDWQALLKK